MNISYQKSQKNLRAGFEQQKITQNIAFFSDKVVNETPKIIINHQVLPVSTKNHKWWPGIPNNQPTWTSNKVLNHFVPRLWGLHKRKVLKSILHCICKIFISPGNSSGGQKSPGRTSRDTQDPLAWSILMTRGYWMQKDNCWLHLMIFRHPFQPTQSHHCPIYTDQYSMIIETWQLRPTSIFIVLNTAINHQGWINLFMFNVCRKTTLHRVLVINNAPQAGKWDSTNPFLMVTRAKGVFRGIVRIHSHSYTGTGP